MNIHPLMWSIMVVGEMYVEIEQKRFLPFNATVSLAFVHPHPER
jgi:hypothetical protein